jgi:hypothetical protein
MPKINAKNLITDWPADSKAMAQAIITRYGDPDETTPSMLVWHRNGPWKRTSVYRDTVKHNFPDPHTDGIEQVIDHVIPMEKACELAAFDGSVVIYCTRGELAVCCKDEAFNFLAINLAHDIIEDRKTFESARTHYASCVIAYRQKKSVPYMEGFQFTLDKDSADPDESIISQSDLNPTAVSS